MVTNQIIDVFVLGTMQNKSHAILFMLYSTYRFSRSSRLKMSSNEPSPIMSRNCFRSLSHCNGGFFAIRRRPFGKGSKNGAHFSQVIFAYNLFAKRHFKLNIIPIRLAKMLLIQGLPHENASGALLLTNFLHPNVSNRPYFVTSLSWHP